MIDSKNKLATRERFLWLLERLTPQEATALRDRCGIEAQHPAPDDDEGTLLALAGELAMLKRKRKK
jgi:hypothetical protein